MRSRAEEFAEQIQRGVAGSAGRTAASDPACSASS
jgi:hypothetical protein